MICPGHGDLTGFLPPWFLWSAALFYSSAAWGKVLMPTGLGERFGFYSGS